ncbi:hypothetical protein PsAD13_03706 [Pseudovibrio sp. Ad13]|uniref:hypothetical protein n=1 Tax=unclassified Pseudovibrio TaxID=2627060 RepID=UPI00070F1663|nr:MULTISPECIES: hypothetical protein [unclassified Pseudovibrio]KZK82152.1 hypothetical protein PsAD13_03706 [Pseudovibrio sp. Ad13]
MYVKVNSTRHTILGTFRFGCVYKVNEKDAKTRKVTKPLMEGDDAPLKRLTAKQVQAESIKYLDLTGPANEDAGEEESEEDGD